MPRGSNGRFCVRLHSARAKNFQKSLRILQGTTGVISNLEIDALVRLLASHGNLPLVAAAEERYDSLAELKEVRANPRSLS
jgi:hypothetical protein